MSNHHNADEYDRTKLTEHLHIKGNSLVKDGLAVIKV